MHLQLTGLECTVLPLKISNFKRCFNYNVRKNFPPGLLNRVQNTSLTELWIQTYQSEADLDLNNTSGQESERSRVYEPVEQHVGRIL
jgi:hypothetical protein